MYFGLQTGWVSMMSMPASLIGFAIFKSLDTRLSFPFTPIENVLVQTVAVAVGSMPLSAGYVGVIPALERLLKPEEGGPIMLSSSKLILWGLGVAFFGVFFAVPLRKQVIIREKLKFPSGTATALMISVLHRTDEKVEAGSVDDHERSDSIDPAIDPIIEKESGWEKKTRLLLYAFLVSGAYTILSYFFPVIRNLPIFGAAAASKWLWTLNPSPAYLGQGIIMGSETTGHMLLGAVIGWAILSPMAKSYGWAPGPVDDWQKGSRGWMVWVSLAIMLSDSILSLIAIILEYGMRQINSREKSRRGSYEPLTQPDTESVSGALTARQRRKLKLDRQALEDDAPPEHLVPNTVVFGGLFLSGLLCIGVTRIVFGQVPLYATVVAFFLALVLSVMGVRALGQTDLNPVSGISKLTQLVFALIVPASNPAAVAINLVVGAVSEAGAQQAGDIMQDLKTGYLLRASPRAQFYGQLIGSIFGAVISAFVYRIYAAVYPIPGELFQVPTAHVWIDCSRLVYGEGLPTGAWAFSIGFGTLFAFTTAFKIYLGRPTPFIPGGIAVAVGMYNVPSFTLARAAGGLIQWYWKRNFSTSGDTMMIILASGLILGEGVTSLANLVMANFRVPHF
ncbi:OPT oligopeptide transporter protein-domain-containing protein [Geopyxis carbonaria]|nr:OPT oligopeptide transporter protein-domain-containing protein [Geopyxis carbonaria]